MRHGDAPAAKSDSQRMLSEKGKAQCLEMSDCLGNNKSSDRESIGRILTSDYQRAIDSASLVSEKLSGKKHHNQTEQLRPNANPKIGIEEILDEVEMLENGESLLVVCHLPVIAELSALLIDGQINNRYSFPCASIMAMEAEFPGEGCFDFLWQENPLTV